ncbi:DUF2627 domain-containing protein [Sediminibacillus halophilus]|uniref:DUF2627 domain-containing protein n=1 Tax=Sediminibacillus halophilus TaxID=482461 RepID=A0A1G9LNK1_9BACI|nr:DUF2627 domain-containing protein [Sediminibacillus halophilus]SDL63115.1 Protein of unknown function [Sediminibacillus halophilus]
MRFIALLILIIPGIAATFGIKLMRDAFFGEFYPLFFHVGIQFTVGLILLLSGLAFIGGFIMFRDRKRNLTKGKYKNNK